MAYGLDRSTMFTNLLTLSPKFGDLEAERGRAVVTIALADWYDSTESDMFHFTKRWIQERATELLPLAAGF